MYRSLHEVEMTICLMRSEVDIRRSRRSVLGGVPDTEHGLRVGSLSDLLAAAIILLMLMAYSYPMYSHRWYVWLHGDVHVRCARVPLSKHHNNNSDFFIENGGSSTWCMIKSLILGLPFCLPLLELHHQQRHRGISVHDEVMLILQSPPPKIAMDVTIMGC